MKPPPQKLKSPMRKNNIGADFHAEALSPTVRAPSASNVKRMENSELLSIRSRPASPLQNFNVFDLKS